MGKVFNTAGVCNPKQHYMVDISDRLKEIKGLIDKRAYFNINRARQYGKTTTLTSLQKYISEWYNVVYMDFQFMSDAVFETEASFVRAFADELGYDKSVPTDIAKDLEAIAHEEVSDVNLRCLFKVLSRWCGVSPKPMVLIIDEVDSATNNQVFLDFLAQLRGYYLHREQRATFQSVILAGVYDVKNIKRKIRPDSDSKVNSPWNIAADFDVAMSLSKAGIAGMLTEYENDHKTGMDVWNIAKLLYEYTEGYPFLVSRICQLMDEKIKAWTKDGFLDAVKMLLSEKNALFESLMGKIQEDPHLEEVVYAILFAGEKKVYNPDDAAIDLAQMFGFVKNKNGNVVIANRIFETRLYNYFLTTAEAQNYKIFKAASDEKNQYLRDNHLNMDRVLQKFVEHFDSIYGDSDAEFDEEEGRRRFLLYLRPIINGTGNYYIEAETRNARRMDVVIDYMGDQFIVELKIWRGNAYNERGEEQLADYLDYFHLKKGYLLSYNFNKNKTVGLHELKVGDKTLVEAVV
jgi:hypothetical protein